MSDYAFGDRKDRLKELISTENKDLMIIGIDFGTTYSGISYHLTGNEDKGPACILSWPGKTGANAPKVPTTISYGKGPNKVMSWGYEIGPANGNKIEAIKLLLDPSQSKPWYVPALYTHGQLGRLGKPAVEVASDYIEALYSHAMTIIEASWPLDFLQMKQKKFVITVPAVWSDRAKFATEKAAKNAGISPIITIKEPEAAALYTLHSLKDKALEAGDAFVLCDAGGGTVDLISYELTKISPFQLRELVPGTGDLCGSLILNRRFEERVKAIVGEEAFAKPQNQKAFRYAMKDFDQLIKPEYMGGVDEEFFVNFPQATLKDEPSMNLVSNCLTVTGEMLRTIFDPVIENIKSLVKDQIDLVKIKRTKDGHDKPDEIKAIFLVGGFGSSAYLRKCLQVAHPTIQVIQPEDAWSAIVRGAVLSQLPREADITSTVATRHYGVRLCSVYSNDEDAGQERCWNEMESKWMVSKMKWYIRIGDDLVRDSAISFRVYRTLPANFTDEHLVFDAELLESHCSDPPKYPGGGLTRPNVKLRADLTSIDRSTLTKVKGVGGKVYYEVHYELILSTDTASMVFSLKYNGEPMGEVEAVYDDEGSSKSKKRKYGE